MPCTLAFALFTIFCLLLSTQHFVLSTSFSPLPQQLRENCCAGGVAATNTGKVLRQNRLFVPFAAVVKSLFPRKAAKPFAPFIIGDQREWAQSAQNAQLPLPTLTPIVTEGNTCGMPKGKAADRTEAHIAGKWVKKAKIRHFVFVVFDRRECLWHVANFAFEKIENRFSILILIFLINFLMAAAATKFSVLLHFTEYVAPGTASPTNVEAGGCLKSSTNFTYHGGNCQHQCFSFWQLVTGNWKLETRFRLLL